MNMKQLKSSKQKKILHSYSTQYVVIALLSKISLLKKKL